MKKKILIVWAGPWGLSAGMILASKWYDVHIFEKEQQVWWRNTFLQFGEYRFDLGPTFFMYKKVLEDIFELSWEDINKYLNFTQLDPLYRLSFWIWDEFFPRAKIEDTKKEIAQKYPQDVKNFDRYIQKEWEKLDAMLPCLEVPYGKISDLFSKRFLRALPKLDVFSTLYDRLSSYFSNDHLKIALTFQSKYLGMSPWKCPASFTILSYLEHKMGIFHVEWWLNVISKAMKEIIEKKWWNIYLGTSVETVLVNDNGNAYGVKLKNWEMMYGDDLIINADFSYAMTHLVDEKFRKKYSNRRIENKEFSCSTFMIYLWLDTQYPQLNHHNIVFNEDYRKFVDTIVDYKDFGTEFSFYIHNPSLIDSSYAPEWHSALYILIPTSNNLSMIDWEAKKDILEQKVYQMIEERFGISDLQKHIRQKHIITPNDWENDYNVYRGAVFNLSHTLSQMLYFRPHNEFEEIKNLYLVGWWTHPWSGLPTIYESGKISARLIQEKYS